MKKSGKHPASLSRRDFMKAGAITGFGLAISPSLAFAKTSKDQKVRIGFIGVGGRGRSHLNNILKREDVLVPAICDIDQIAIDKSLNMISKAGDKKPTVFTGSNFAFLDLLARDDIDGVIIATPWVWHTKMAVSAMKAGKYAGVEVSAANTMAECWDLVNTYESTGIPTMIMENVCYRRDVMAEIGRASCRERV